jgi:hypothetical protein
MAHYWASFASRCVMYRIFPEMSFHEQLGTSGLVLYCDGEQEGSPGVIGPAVVGFQSFLQPHAGRQSRHYGDMSQFDIDFAAGTMAFFGAFQVPPDVRKHAILQAGIGLIWRGVLIR